MIFSYNVFQTSIVLLLIGKQLRKLTVQLVNLLIDILNVLTISFVLSLFILLLVSLFVLGAEFVVNFAFLLTFFLN